MATEDSPTISEAAKPKPLTHPDALRRELRAQHPRMSQLGRAIESASAAHIAADLARPGFQPDTVVDENDEIEQRFQNTWKSQTAAERARDDLAQLYGYDSAASWDATFALFTSTYGSPLHEE